MKRKIILTLFILALIITINMIIPKNIKAANQIEFFSKEISWEWKYHDKTEELMAYGFFIPSDAEKCEKLPMIVWLHGSGETAVNKNTLKNAGLPKAIRTKGNLENFRAYVLCPHLLDANGSWQKTKNKERVRKLFQYIFETYNIDTENVVICGESRGGTGALDWANDNKMSKYFSKCVAFSAFYAGPFNKSIDTICCYSYTGDDASAYAKYWRQAFGEKRVFDCSSGHGSVGYSFIRYDNSKLAKARSWNSTEINVQIL